MSLLSFFRRPARTTRRPAARTARRRPAGVLEIMEGRLLLSTATPREFGDGYVITGTNGADVIRLDDAPGGQVVVTEQVNGRTVELARWKPQQYSPRIQINALGGNDVVKNYSSFGMYAIGGAGDDILVGGNGSDNLIGDDLNAPNVSGNDQITGLGGADDIDAGPGNDYVNGDGAGTYADPKSYGNDIIVGGPGDDTIYGDLGNDSIWGDDPVVTATAPAVLATANGRDWISAGDGDDTVRGQGGNDTVTGGYGKDSITGGSGDDSLSGGGDDDNINGEAGKDNLLGGDGKDILVGGTGDDSLSGEYGDDKLYGELGNDNLYGGSGADFLYGGYGNDSAWGGYGNDTIQGEWGNDTLRGEDGDDMILGGDGDDTVWGDAGNDILVGGVGADAIDTQKYGRQDENISKGNDVIVTDTGTDDGLADSSWNDGFDLVMDGKGDVRRNNQVGFDYGLISDNDGFTMGIAAGSVAMQGVMVGRGIGFAADGIFTYESVTEVYGVDVSASVALEFTTAPTKTMNSFSGHNHGISAGGDLLVVGFSTTSWLTDDGKYAGQTNSLSVGVGVLPLTLTYQSQTTWITPLVKF